MAAVALQKNATYYRNGKLYQRKCFAYTLTFPGRHQCFKIELQLAELTRLCYETIFSLQRRTGVY